MSSFALFLNKVLSRNGILVLGLAALLALAPAMSEARPGNGSSAGSRGSKTHSAPPATSTAPNSAAPMERSMTQQPVNNPAASAASAAAAPARNGMFGGMFGGFGGGLMAGLLGAGLVGMLFGNGMMGGLGGIASILGLVLQLALLFFVVRFAMNWFANRNRPAMAGAAERSAYQGGPAPGPQGGFGGLGGGAAPQQPQAPVATPIQVQDADFGGFERLLGEVQSAYGDENIERLRMIATHEMAAYFSQEIAENTRNGVINKISGVKLLQGDLAEAWREGDEEYASVAMRYSLIDVKQDRATGRIVAGDASAPQQAVEVWTFLRPAGAGPQDWKLSAIQQAS
jgi:predicted lipid-binding transport protein (Tim44 family)